MVMGVLVALCVVVVCVLGLVMAVLLAARGASTRHHEADAFPRLQPFGKTHDQQVAAADVGDEAVGPRLQAETVEKENVRPGQGPNLRRGRRSEERRVGTG